MRVFAAIDPPDHVSERLDEFLGPRRGSDGAPSFGGPDQWHVTLAFAASAGARAVDRMSETLRAATDERASFDVTLGGAGVFPGVPHARVLWLGVRSAPESTLDRLASGARTGMRAAGADVEGGRFVGHLTLGRWRRPLDATRWLRVCDAFEPVSWRVDEVVLLESHVGQGPGGRSRYELLETFPLPRPRLVGGNT